jgi:hypothetical protein
MEILGGYGMNFKLLKVILFILGLISLIYSWIQSFPVSGRSDEYASLLLIRTVKHYVFLTSGIILFILSYIIEFIEKKFIEVKNNNIQ